jgi:hypothetical protein
MMMDQTARGSAAQRGEGSATATRALTTTAIAGIASAVLLFGAQGLMQIGGAEPAFDASAGEILAFFEARHPQLYPAGAYLSVLGLAAFLWFLGGMYAVLRSREGGSPWRSTVALISGVVFVALVGGSGWQLAVFRTTEGLDPQLARLAFDMGNLGFASSWVALGSFAIATGWAILSSSVLARWLGWWAVVAGVGLVAARAAWTSPFWIAPYLLFWIWVIVVSVVLLRRRDAHTP